MPAWYLKSLLEIARFLSLIIISTLVDYVVGTCLSKTDTVYKRKLLLILSIVVNLGILGFFKYYNFFVSSLVLLLKPVGFNLKTLNIILPIGISFYTFQTLSYTIDLYRRKIEPEKSLLDFAVFVGFFPQLVAGPIVRAAHFLPQLKSPAVLTGENFVIGFRLFIIGLFKKVFIADRLAMFVDPVFANSGAFDCITTWMAVVAYSIQIYCDFAGYSDMAIGAGKIMGYDLNTNFDFPYLSKSIREFWRRWHISLSTWIRDYLYIPLGGSRKGHVRTYINIMVSMLLCGLWHGAAWTFVFWGGLHGVSLAVSRIWSNFRKTGDRGETYSSVAALSKWALTMFVVIIGWVFFRSQDFQHAFIVLGQMFNPKPGIMWYQPFVIFILLTTALFHLLQALKLCDFLSLPVKAWYTPAALFSMIWLILVFYPKEFKPFIYFQF
ncbi:MAG TPA: MBOAT family protein [Candidatus Dependentiae bacterium]|nr:MBOAT family protein [Candidatus Dependentiae bacterium]